MIYGLPRAPYLYSSGVNGVPPSTWSNFDVPNETYKQFLSAGVGTLYVYQTTDHDFAKPWFKIEDQGQTEDYVALGGVHVIQETVAYSAFTDGGGAAGTFTLTNGTIPLGATVLASTAVAITGFTGDTSCTLTIGDGSTADRYMTGTPSIFTTADAVDLGAVSGTATHSAAKSVVLTATSGSDWGLVTAGSVTVRVFYVF